MQYNAHNWPIFSGLFDSRRWLKFKFQIWILSLMWLSIYYITRNKPNVDIIYIVLKYFSWVGSQQLRMGPVASYYLKLLWAKNNFFYCTIAYLLNYYVKYWHGKWCWRVKYEIVFKGQCCKLINEIMLYCSQGNNVLLNPLTLYWSSQYI